MVDQSVSRSIENQNRNIYIRYYRTYCASTDYFLYCLISPSVTPMKNVHETIREWLRTLREPFPRLGRYAAVGILVAKSVLVYYEGIGTSERYFNIVLGGERAPREREYSRG